MLDNRIFMRNQSVFLAAIVMMLLTGCSVVAKPIMPGISPRPTNAVVFGRLNIQTRSRAGINLKFQNMETGKDYVLAFLNYPISIGAHRNDDPLGYFVTQLPAGQYRLYRIDQMDAAMVWSMDINLVFDVESGRENYIGDMRYEETDVKSQFLIVGTHKVSFEVLDKRQNTMDYLNNQGYELGDNVRTSLLRDYF